MADTPRTLNELLTSLFPNGLPDDSITAQRIRDFIVSFRLSRGTQAVSTPAATTISTPETWVKVAGTFTAIANSVDFDLTTDNRLLYTGTITKEFDISFVGISAIADTNNIKARFGVAKNGTITSQFRTTRKIGTGNDEGSCSIGGQVTLAQNDYAELFVTSDTASQITVQNVTLKGVGGL